MVGEDPNEYCYSLWQYLCSFVNHDILTNKMWIEKSKNSHLQPANYVNHEEIKCLWKATKKWYCPFEKNERWGGERRKKLRRKENNKS